MFTNKKVIYVVQKILSFLFMASKFDNRYYEKWWTELIIYAQQNYSKKNMIHFCEW
jgi:hypothetical protein